MFTFWHSMFNGDYWGKEEQLDDQKKEQLLTTAMRKKVQSGKEMQRIV